METSPLALVSIVRRCEDRTYGTFAPVDADRLSEDLRVRCLEAIERCRAEHGTAPNRLVIETTGRVTATSQTGSEGAPPAGHNRAGRACEGGGSSA
jgi:hypothetical protein